MVVSIVQAHVDVVDQPLDLFEFRPFFVPAQLHFSRRRLLLLVNPQLSFVCLDRFLEVFFLPCSHLQIFFNFVHFLFFDKEPSLIVFDEKVDPIEHFHRLCHGLQFIWVYFTHTLFAVKIATVPVLLHVLHYFVRRKTRADEVVNGVAFIAHQSVLQLLRLAALRADVSHCNEA